VVGITAANLSPEENHGRRKGAAQKKWSKRVKSSKNKQMEEHRQTGREAGSILIHGSFL
jgi:hypothetical protein